MELTTTPSMEGRKITRYCGIVAGEAVLGANVFKDMFASVRDIVGGRSGTYEKELRKARQIALDELSEQAREVSTLTMKCWAKRTACSWYRPAALPWLSNES